MISEKLKFGMFRSQKPIDLRETRKILEINKIIWKLPQGPYTVTMQRHFAPHDFASYQDYFDLYELFGPIGQALDIKNNMIWQNGFDVEAKTDSDKEKLNQLMANLEIDVTFDSASLTALQCGNAYFSLITEGDLPELRPLDPLTISADVDKETGKVTKYYQMLVNQQPIPFEPEQIVHLAFRKPRGVIFGVGNLRRNLASAKALLYMRQKVPEIVRKRADNPLNVKVGDPDHRVSDEVWTKTLADLKGHQPGEDYINDGWVTFDEVYKNLAVGRGSIMELFQIFERDLIAGLGVPEEALGFAQSTTQATALYQKAQLEQEIRKYQRTIKRLLESRIFPLAEIEDARIIWRPLSPEDENLKATRMDMLVKSGIIGPKFARKQLGYPEEEAAEGAMSQPSGSKFPPS
jgi:hypothetical protein